MKTKTNYNKMITKYKLFESKNGVFEIGTKVVCSKGNQDGIDMFGLIGTIKLILPLSSGEVNYKYLHHYLSYYIKFEKKDNLKIFETLNRDRESDFSWTVHHSFVHLYGTDIQEVEKQRRERIEQLKQKYKDIDPLGEENWDDED